MTAAHRLPTAHVLLALAVVTIWGTNFVVIKVALAHLPPLLLALLRFVFTWLPAALLVRRPPVPWRKLLLYGLFIGPGQFGLLYLAMDGQISPGLASLVVQNQVFFTIVLAIWFDGERLRAFQWAALALAAAGVVLIALNTGGDATGMGLAMVLTAAACWGGSNQTARSMGRTDMLGVVVWSALFALPPLVAMTLGFEGPARIAQALRDADAAVWAAVLWQALANTVFCFAAWGWLLSRHPTATIAPMALLVPVIGMATAALVTAEAMPAWKLAATALVLAGLALNLFWPRRA